MRRKNCVRYCVYTWFGSMLILLVYFELYFYYEKTNTWYPLKCNIERMCTRILLVADPQIIGKHNEIVHFLTPFSIYDSDKYLAKTYSHAFQFAKPDVVIFLGDLMDEGSTASSEEYKQYAKRLFNIFINKQTSTIRHIWLPGDNDIGGEGYDRVLPEKINKFEHVFAQPDTIYHNNITFYKINRLTQNIPKIPDNREFYDMRRIIIGLSHIPIMFTPSVFADKVLAKMQPHVLFTAHEHKAMIISADATLRQDRHIIPLSPDNNNVFTYQLGSTDMYEILVPTCSYRMGTNKIGYGFAIIEGDELRYTVLWSPSRFPQLLLYAGVAILTAAFVLTYYCAQLASKRRAFIYKTFYNVE